jgi:hypothetical protein
MVPSQPKPWLSPEATAAVEMIAGLPRAAHPPMGHEVVCPELQAFSKRVLSKTVVSLSLSGAVILSPCFRLCKAMESPDQEYWSSSDGS